MFTKKKIQYALIELPTTLDRFIELPQIGDKHYIIMLDDVIRFCLHKIFNIFNYESLTANMIKITRDAELDIDDDLSKSFIEKNLYQCGRPAQRGTSAFCIRQDD